MGQLEESRKALDEAIALYQRLGDWQHWGVCMAMAAQAAYWSGDFHRGVDLWTELYATARKRGDRLQQAWGLNGQSEGLLRIGSAAAPQQAIALLQTATGLFTENIDKVSAMSSYGLLAVAHFRAGNLDLACHAARQTMRLIEQSSATSYYALVGYASAANTYFELCEHRSGPDSKPFLRETRGVRGIGPLCADVPGGPAQRLALSESPRVADGEGQGRDERVAQVHRYGGAAEDALRRGLAHAEIGRHLPAADAARSIHLAQANALLAAAGASFDLTRLQQKLCN